MVNSLIDLSYDLNWEGSNNMSTLVKQIDTDDFSQLMSCVELKPYMTFKQIKLQKGKN